MRTQAHVLLAVNFFSRLYLAKFAEKKKTDDVRATTLVVRGLLPFLLVNCSINGTTRSVEGVRENVSHVKVMSTGSEGTCHQPEGSIKTTACMHQK